MELSCTENERERNRRMKKICIVIILCRCVGGVESLTELFSSDIVDIKPANMEDLTEVITAAEFHPHHCHLFVYSSSKGTLRLCDMRASALCDKHTKREHVVDLTARYNFVTSSCL